MKKEIGSQKVLLKGVLFIGNRRFQWETEIRTKKNDDDKDYLLDDVAQEILNEIKKLESGDE